MKRLFSVFWVCLIMSACTGTTVEPDPNEPNNPAGSKGDAAAGEAAYKARCLTCHSLDGTSPLGGKPIISAKTAYRDGLSLQNYLSEDMPPFGAGEPCTGDCAKDIAAFIVAQGWKLKDNSAPSQAITFSKAPGTNIEVPSTSCDTMPSVAETMLVRDQIKNALADIVAPINIDNLDALLDTLPGTERTSEITDLFVTSLLNIGESVGPQVANSFNAMNLNCNAGSQNQRNCAKVFLEQRGSLALTRNLSTEETEKMLTDLFDPENDFSNGLTQLIKALLVSTEFLYQFERGENASDGSIVLTSIDKAKKLSWLMLNSIPDAELLSAATSGALDTEAGLKAQINRLIEDDRFKRSLAFFNRSWMYLDPEDSGNPSLTEDAVHEIDLLVQAAFENNESLADLFTTQRAFVNSQLAATYGINKQMGANVFEEVSLDNRPGVLTRAAILAGTSHGANSVTRRGHIISESMLCSTIKDPSAEIQDMFPTLLPRNGGSTRSAVERTMEQQDICATCHFSMDPFGFTLEHFDHEGKYREKEDGTIEIDDFVNTSIIGQIDGYQGLADNISNSDTAAACYAKHWFIHAFRRISTEDSCVVEDLEKRFIEADGDLNALIRLLVESPAMHFRKI